VRDPLGLLLTLPVESVAVRAVLASALGVLLVRLLLRTGVRSVVRASPPRWRPPPRSWWCCCSRHVTASSCPW
jgi:hypothetical protein